MTKNELKVIAAFCMAIDHIGAKLFPQFVILRIIGRVSFPIFAYSIYEGSKYTRNKAKYLLKLLILGMVCIVGYYLYSGKVYGNVLITFALSLLILYSINLVEKSYDQPSGFILLLAHCVFFGSIGISIILCSLFTIDYGFIGVILPVFAELFYIFGKILNKEKIGGIYEKLPLLGLGVGLVVLSALQGGIQIYCLLSLFLLAASNGQNGTWHMKYFFYGFYPAHIMLIGVSAAAKCYICI